MPSKLTRYLIGHFTTLYLTVRGSVRNDNRCHVSREFHSKTIAAIGKNFLDKNYNSKTLTVSKKGWCVDAYLPLDNVFLFRFLNSQISSLSRLSFSLSLTSCLEWHSRDHGGLHVHVSKHSPFHGADRLNIRDTSTRARLLGP